MIKIFVSGGNGGRMVVVSGKIVIGSGTGAVSGTDVLAVCDGMETFSCMYEHVMCQLNTNDSSLFQFVAGMCYIALKIKRQDNMLVFFWF